MPFRTELFHVFPAHMGLKNLVWVSAHTLCILAEQIFSLWNILKKEHTKYITKQESLPEKCILLWGFLIYKRVSQWFHRHSTRPRKNLPCLTCPRMQYCNCKTECKKSCHFLRWIIETNFVISSLKVKKPNQNKTPTN